LFKVSKDEVVWAEMRRKKKSSRAQSVRKPHPSDKDQKLTDCARST